MDGKTIRAHRFVFAARGTWPVSNLDQANRLDLHTLP
jgi:hypothetical protein